MTELFLLFLNISVSAGCAAAVLLLLSALVGGRYAAKWRCWVWILLAMRLILPFDLFSTAGPAPAHSGEGLPSQQFERAILCLPAWLSEPDADSMPPQDLAGSSMTQRPGISFTDRLTPLDIAAVIWFDGALLYLAFTFLSCIHFRRKVIRTGKHAPAGIARAFATLACRGGIPVILSPLALSPMMIGFGSPVLILPRYHYSPEQLHFILRHEAAHYRRRDVWFKLMFVVASAIHWFNPVVWLLKRQAGLDMELACDEEVIRGESAEMRAAYTETLFAALSRHCSAASPLSAHFYGGKQIMKKRFDNILSRMQKRNGLPLLIAAVVLIVGMSAAVGCSVREEPAVSESPAGPPSYAEAVTATEGPSPSETISLSPALNSDASSDSTTPDAVTAPKPVSADHFANDAASDTLPSSELISEGDYTDDNAPAGTAHANDTPAKSAPEQTLSDEALAVKEATEAFSAAFFAADEKTLRQYLADNYEYPVELYSYPAEMAQNITFRGLDAIEAADNGQTAFVSVQFVNTPESEDSYQYLSIELVKQKGGWKVRFYGIEG